MVELVAPEERHGAYGSGLAPRRRRSRFGPRRHPARRRSSSARRASPRRRARSASERRRRRRTRPDHPPDTSAHRGWRRRRRRRAVRRPLPSSQSVVGATPMPTTTTSAGTTSPPASRTPSAVSPSMKTPQRTSTPWRAMQVGDRLAHLGAETADERRGGPFEHDDVVAEPLRGGRDLESDEAGTDHHDAPPARRDLGAQAEGVVERAQLVHVVEGGLAGEPARTGARGDDETVETEDRSVGETELRAAGRAPSPRCRGATRRRGRRTRRAGGGGCDRAPTRRPAASSTAAAGRTGRCTSSPTTTIESRHRVGAASLPLEGRRVTLRRRPHVRAVRRTSWRRGRSWPQRCHAFAVARRSSRDRYGEARGISTAKLARKWSDHPSSVRACLPPRPMTRARSRR